MAIKFNSNIQNAYLNQGEIRNNTQYELARDSLAITKKKVEATKHSIYSGAPGVGKTFTFTDLIKLHKLPYVMVTAGMTEIELTSRLAHGIANLKKGEELIVLVDDADDVVFDNIRTLNRWKIATADIDPYWSYPKDISPTILKAEKSKNYSLASALKKFRTPSSLGLEIPLDRARVIILCNTDLEDPKSLSKKLFSSAEAVIDRFKYERLDMPWQEKWGWLAYVLSNTQPFEDEYNVILDDSQKKELLNFLYTNWQNLKSKHGASYRFVRKLAEEQVNHPDDYIDRWARMVK
jgi:hypothetical protein